MNNQEKTIYRARMAVAQLFLSFLGEGEGRADLLHRLGVSRLPVIVPALDDTKAVDIRQAVQRHFDAGEAVVIIPVGVRSEDRSVLKLSVLFASPGEPQNFWQINMDDLHDDVEMAQVVEALEPGKRWDMDELEQWDTPEAQDLKGTASAA